MDVHVRSVADRPIPKRRFEREARQLFAMAAVQELEGRLNAGRPLEVEATLFRGGGQRVSFLCADGTRLRMHLFWPRTAQVRCLTSLRFDDRIGWIATGLTSNGLLDFHGWRAIVDHPVPADQAR